MGGLDHGVCVSSVKYLICFNSNTTEAFMPLRGIIQGDLLSPYLFLLCTEGLSSMLSHAENCEELVGGYKWDVMPILSHISCLRMIP
jgi:hypothetical protein